MKKKVQQFLSVSSAFALAITYSTATMAQASSDDQGSEKGTDNKRVIIVSGSRLPADITSVPGTINIVDEAEIDVQSAISSDLGRILANSVPGFAPSTNDGNNFSQTLRGRKPSYFIDGVPQSAELRGGGRDLRILHPSVLERVEVINGATSLYGLGGSGGVVNYITKKPKGDGVNATSELGLSSSLTSFGGDSMEYSLAQTVSVREGRFDAVGSFSYQTRGLYYDANGKPIPPDPTGQTGIADMTEISVFGRVGIDLTDRIRWENTVLFYNAEVDTDFTVAQGSFAGGVISVAEPKRQNNISIGPISFDFIGVRDPRNYNLFGSSSLTVSDVLGGSAQLRAYGKKSELTWRHLDFIALAPTLGGFPPNGSQLQTFDDRAGIRLDFDTPLELGFLNGDVLWGVEYSVNHLQDKLIDGRIRTSRLRQTNAAGFVQIQADITDWLHLRTGIRHDEFTLKIPSFNALDSFSAAKFHSVIGTKLDYSSTTANFGLVGDVTDEISLFGAWSSGFSIGNVARTISGLRPRTNVPPVIFDVASLGQIIEPVKVDSYEAGVRWNFDWFEGSATIYRNESKLGASFDPISLQVVRAPERIEGIEVAASVNIGEIATIGGTYAVARSKVDSNNDGTFDNELDFSRVPPALLNAYVDVRFAPDWSARLQAYKIFDESRFTPPFGQLQRDIKGYTVFDMFVTGKVGPVKLSIGVENLFNNDYVPIATLLNCSDNVVIDSFCNVAPVGARGTLRLTFDY